MYNGAKKQARIQELITPNCSTVYVKCGIKHSHTNVNKPLSLSVFCPVNVVFTHHDPDTSSPYDENMSF